MTQRKHFQKPELTVSELSRALYEANRQLNLANQELADTNEKLNEANTRLNEANRRLQEANQSLLKNQQSQMHFYANTSHDLRAPITAISNFSEYLLSQFTVDPNGNSICSMDTAEMYRILSHIHSRADYMKYLINDIFLLSSLESSDARLKPEPVNVGFFLEDFYYMCAEDAYYSRVELCLNIPDGFDCTLEWDPELMHRVLDNLFTNAVKYSSEHPVITLGAYTRMSKDTEEVCIYVEDNGIGIPTEDLKHIFERSYQVNAARTPTADAGTGLGLSIVKSIVELHHGNIICESVLHEGSRLTMSFPLVV